MTVRVGINGFGRIGRNFYRAAKQAGADLEFVAVNDLGDTATMAHLLKYDSILGTLPQDVSAVDGGISVDGQVLQVLSERNPAELPWADLGVDVVIESTGVFTARDKAALHLEGGAPYVIVSAPSTEADKTFVMGVNEDTFNPETDKVVSNGSCTTNCFVVMVKVLDDAFGVQEGMMTTIHAYTGDQPTVDSPHGDLRRARAAGVNIIPTSTGAARATSLVMQSMQGRLDGVAMRVPVAVGSITDFTCVLEQPATVDEINAAYKAAATEGRLAAVLDYTEAPIVSSDIVTTPASATIDAGITATVGSLVKVAGWYDNEWGFSNRLVDLSQHIGMANQ